MIVASIKPEFDSWRTKARDLLAGAVSPDGVLWEDPSGGQHELFGDAGVGVGMGETGIGNSEKSTRIRVKSEFLNLARTVSCHSDPERWALLYRLLWRMAMGGEVHLLQLTTDSEMVRAGEMAKSVRRDCHKMRAFVRFRKVGEDPETKREKFVSWFEPDHFIEEYNAPFFQKRFTGMDWSIFTPKRSIHWDGMELRVGDGVRKDEVPDDDASDELWRSYYRSIFNPARLKLKAMQSEMPKKYWKNLPEAPLIEELTREASARKSAMIDADALIPKRAPKNRYLSKLEGMNESPIVRESSSVRFGELSLHQLNEKAAGCRSCPLWNRATQTVFGEGPEHAELMIVGEQPGDEEDISGRPFQGPAGRLLNGALKEVGLDRGEIYLTNAVKHFKWKPQPRGKRRIHDKANRGERMACRPWLLAEIAKVKPRVIITLGNSAAQSLVDEKFQVLRERGEKKGLFPETDEVRILATVHPSYLLRMRGDGVRSTEYDLFVSQLKLAKSWLKVVPGENSEEA